MRERTADLHDFRPKAVLPQTADRAHARPSEAGQADREMKRRSTPLPSTSVTLTIAGTWRSTRRPSTWLPSPQGSCTAAELVPDAVQKVLDTPRRRSRLQPSSRSRAARWAPAEPDPLHSITLADWSSIDSGTVKPRSRAAWALMVS